MADESRHTPVLAEQVMELLSPAPGEVCVDCTLGLGGHAALLANAIAPGGRMIGLDVDPGNIELARAHLPAHCELHRANFADLPSYVDQADVVLADLGFASNQMADPARGLTFQEDGPLDMRLDPTLAQTAGDLVNQLPQDELANVLYHYGDERLSRKIARKIVEHRVREPIETTGSLAALVRQAYGPKRQRIHPATRTFMALRIAVNGELEALEQLLAALPKVLRADGRAAIISFHSLEDRLVKQAFARWDKQGLAKRLTKKPITADPTQRSKNPRSRSAKLRGIRWIGRND